MTRETLYVRETEMEETVYAHAGTCVVPIASPPLEKKHLPFHKSLEHARRLNPQMGHGAVR